MRTGRTHEVRCTAPRFRWRCVSRVGHKSRNIVPFGNMENASIRAERQDRPRGAHVGHRRGVPDSREVGVDSGATAMGPSQRGGRRQPRRCLLRRGDGRRARADCQSGRAAHWTFKLRRRGDEVVRWDRTAPPARHSNPPGRPAGFPGKVTALEHEHRWVKGFEMNCAVPLDLSASTANDHRQALAAFCDRATISFDATYQPPPPPGEQLQLG